MRKIVHFLLVVAVLAGLGLTLWIGIRKHAATAEPSEKTGAGEKAAEEEKPEAFTVKIEKEQAEALGIEKADLEKAELTPRITAFGRVLDPTPLITLDDEIAAAEAALAASRAENERSQKLLAAGENTSRKAAEAAEAQFRADQIKAESLRRRALLEWGSAFAALDASQRREFTERLVAGRSALVRVDTLPGDAVTEQPKSARFVVLGREEQPIETVEITPAADTDPKTQAQGFVLRVDDAPFVLRPGMALTAWLEMPGKARAGFAIPRSAILRHDGRAWVYVQEDEETFVRKPVVLDTPLEADKGWFIAAEGGGLAADDLLVVVGGESLLSEELKAQSGGGEPD